MFRIFKNPRHIIGTKIIAKKCMLKSPINKTAPTVIVVDIKRTDRFVLLYFKLNEYIIPPIIGKIDMIGITGTNAELMLLSK